jgi:2-polyprenyl-3-methyl-5-hydroxy-6-metoxy-1,4-benzoquinol methylase
VAGLDSLHLVKAHLALALFIELYSEGIHPSETTSTPQLHNMLKDLPSRAARCVYRFPFVGIRFRMFLESCLGQRSYQNRTYWNESLNGWASPYLGGTLSIDLRNSITVLLAKALAPPATSLLDLGCAGATLALCLGPEFKTYSGVDISDVAISKARENLAADKRHLATKYSLETGQVQDFQPSQQFDVIVFNEVLYYLSLEQVAAVIRRYSRFLSPGGLILVSLKDDEVSRLVQEVASRELKFEYGVLYQQQLQYPCWKTVRNRETPAYLVQALRPLK